MVESPEKSRQGAADVGEIGDPAARSGGPGQKRQPDLQQNPEHECAPRRNRKPVAPRHQSAEYTPGKQHEREPHLRETDRVTGDHPGNESARADTRNIRARIEERMQQRRTQPGSQQQKQILSLSEFILDIIPADQQKIEVAD